MAPIGQPRLLTPDEAADLCRVSTSTLYRWARAGLIPTIRIGGTVRIPRIELEHHLAPTTELRDPGA